MRLASVSQIKGRANYALSQKPAEGTKLRELYDRFMVQRGKIVTFSAGTGAASVQINQLRDFYGLDIRNVGRGRWVLAGEWVGRVYVDYIAERLKEQEVLQ